MRLSQTAFVSIISIAVVRSTTLLPTTIPTTTPFGQASTSGVSESQDDEDVEVKPVPLTEQVMDPRIKVKSVADVEDPSEDPNWDANRAVRDVAYFLRAHKYQDYDRRYYKSGEESVRQFYEEFPDPPLRSLHWEVRRHCEQDFRECLKYLERIIKLTALRREDDTVTVMKEQKWSLANNTEQILAAQRDCQMAQKRDNLTMVPFQGPIERFQWRSSASYYMCWYTMLGISDLAVFGESCDNHANCMDEYGTHNRDPRADDTKPYACALYSFCPDHCCPIKHIWYMKDCFQSPLNPCYAVNPPAHRKCTLNRDENVDFDALKSNKINVSCECRQTGYEWSSRFSICVDVNECVRNVHNCSLEAGQTCVNLPGYFDCICRLGYVYSSDTRSCVRSATIEMALSEVGAEQNVSETASLLALIVRMVTGSADADVTLNTASLLVQVVLTVAVF